MVNKFPILLSFMLLCCWHKVVAQTVLQIRVAPSEWQHCQNLLQTYSHPDLSIVFDSTITLGANNTAIFPPASQAILRPIIAFLHQKQYLAASFDHLAVVDSTHIQAYLHLGSMITWATIRTTSLTQKEWFNTAGLSIKKWENTPLQYDQLIQAENKLLRVAEEHGYPFAVVWLDSIEMNSHLGVSGMLQLQLNRYFTFNAPRIKGNLKLPKGFMGQYLGIKTGAPYNRAQVLRLREQLRALPYLELNGNPTVSFVGDKATINLPLQRKRAGRFDFIIGLLPQPNSSDGRVLLTGSVNALFLNAFNMGERLSLDFERLRPETQKLDVQAAFPYLLGSPFGVEGRLHIFRRDSSWVDAQSTAGIQYLFEGADAIQFFWENKSSSLQKIDQSTLLNTRKLPANLDFKQNAFGLDVQYTRLDYKFNPRRGWATLFRGSAGYNTILRNPEISALVDSNDPAFKFSTLYDTLTLRSARFRLEARAEYFIPIFKRSTILLRLRAASIIAQEPVLQNEQYRLGGNRLLRGFDEESLFATRWGVGTFELRLLTGPNSYFAAFTDYGYIENISARTRAFLRPWGMGGGMNFETKAGVFGINIAVGRRDTGQGVDFRATKIHLGYVSLF